MLKLLPVVIISLVLAALAHFFSDYDIESGEYLRKDKVIWLAMAIVMIGFVGLRTAYNDTSVYRDTYQMIDISKGIFVEIDWRLGENPGYIVVARLLKTLGFSVQSYLMFYAAITLGICMWFIRKYSGNLWLSVFLFIAMGCFTFTLAAIKQCAAMALGLVATDRALQKKYGRFILWVLLAALFHAYALMYLIIPLLMFRPWSGKTWVLLGVFGLTGVFLQPLLGTVISITTLLGEEYDAASFSGEGVNPFRLAVVAVPVVLSFMTRRVIAAKGNKENNLFLNLSMLNAEIMFVGLFGTANYFGRLANYFLVFQVLTLPWLFTHFEPRSKRFVTVMAIVCYTVYFYYANVINQHFDSIFKSITLGEYLRSLFMGA